MNWKKTTAAVVPCYNEEATIKQLLHGIGKHLKTIFVVDDGSGDSTGSEALAGGALVLRHEKNRGKGAALHTGLCAASERGFSWAVLLDGDGQHCPADIPRLFSCAEMTGAQLVIGDRLRERGSMSWLRRIVNFWMSRELSRLAGYPLRDSQCGFRLVNLGAWRALDFKTTRFEAESEMVLGFAAKRLRIEFVPVKTIPRTRPSHIHPLWDTWRWFKWRNSVKRDAAREHPPVLHQSKSLPA